MYSSVWTSHTSSLLCAPNMKSSLKLIMNSLWFEPALLRESPTGWNVSHLGGLDVPHVVPEELCELQLLVWGHPTLHFLRKTTPHRARVKWRISEWAVAHKAEMSHFDRSQELSLDGSRVLFRFLPSASQKGLPTSQSVCGKHKKKGLISAC